MNPVARSERLVTVGTVGALGAVGAKICAFGIAHQTLAVRTEHGTNVRGSVPYIKTVGPSPPTAWCQGRALTPPPPLKRHAMTNCARIVIS